MLEGELLLDGMLGMLIGDGRLGGGVAMIRSSRSVAFIHLSTVINHALGWNSEL